MLEMKLQALDSIARTMVKNEIYPSSGLGISRLCQGRWYILTEAMFLPI